MFKILQNKNLVSKNLLYSTVSSSGNDSKLQNQTNKKKSTIFETLFKDKEENLDEFKRTKHLAISSDSKVTTQISKNDEKLIEKSLLKTKLNERHRILAEGGIPPAIYADKREKWEIGERFGQFGLASKVDIRKLWPTVEEIEEENNLKLYRTLSSATKIAEKRKVDEQKRLQQREEEIAANLTAYSKELEDYKNHLKKAETNKTEKEEELEKKIRTVQEYFGYWIDPKDPRFEVIFRQKDLEEKKAAKKAKKEAQKNKFTAQQ